MITYFRAVQRDLDEAENESLVFQAQEWKVDRLGRETEMQSQVTLAARWSFAFWQKRQVTVTTADLVPLGEKLVLEEQQQTVLERPQLITVNVARCEIDWMVLKQARNPKAIEEAAKQKLMNLRNLKPGCRVSDGRGGHGELVGVELLGPTESLELDPQRRPSRASPLAGLAMGPVRPLEVVALEWYMGWPEDLGTVDDLIDP